MKTFDASTPEINGFSIKKEIKEESTIKSIKNLEISMAQKLRINNSYLTPNRQSPREPILSRHYYELLKKKELSNLI